ncbi:MAG: invasion associated locus B family protein [Alphaproteobacteria bacterium]
MKHASILLAAALTLAAPAAFAQEGKVLGKFEDWVAQTFKEGSNTGCSMWTQPTKSEGKYTTRGPVYAYVTHRPWDKKVNEVSINIGYPFKPDSKAELRIDSNKPLTLFTDGESAWNKLPADDAALIKAMRNGGSMLVKGTSGRGTVTTDTFSLKGFAAALDAISKACKVS